MAMSGIYKTISLDYPLISIIIPLYNYERFIGECLMSCIEQTYKNIEILVIDDCSTDGGLEIAMEAVALDDRIKVHKLPENRGYSAAKNVGIRASRGEYIAHLDADDLLLSDSIKVRLEAFRDDIDMVHELAWRYRKINGNGRRTAITRKLTFTLKRF